MKTLLINLMGTSPMVATEMYEYLNNSGEHISDILFVHTKNQFVKHGTFAAVASLASKYNAYVHLLELNFDDILDEKSMICFIKSLADKIKEEREKYGINKIIANVSGGRKIQTIITSMYSSIFKIDEVYNIINKDIANINEGYEKIRDKVEGFSGNENDIELYKKYDEIFDRVFYPDLQNIFFLKVPVVKIPDDGINRIKILLNSKLIEDTDFKDFELKSYRDSGFITYDKTRIYNTELGDILKSYLDYF